MPTHAYHQLILFYAEIKLYICDSKYKVLLMMK